MNRKYFFLLLLALMQAFFSLAQQDSGWVKKDSIPADTIQRKLAVAIFTPLYLDSAFDYGNVYRYGKTFPKFINPGLEFYEGASLAIDSLKKEGAELDFYVFDTRSAKKSLVKLLQDTVLNNIDLFIGHVSAYEARLLADAAGKKGVPFINSNFPNDAGVTNNPNYVILNSTLITHIRSLYRFLQRNFALSPITIFTKKSGPLEDVLKDYIAEIEKTTGSVPLKIEYVTLDPTFTAKTISQYLDSNTTNVVIGGSLDTHFGQLLVQELASISNSYATTIFGMPTWDILDFTKPAFKNLEIYYSTPFYISPVNKIATVLTANYKSRFYVKPTDMVLRGYESVFRFTKLLLQHKSNLRTFLSDKKYSIFTDFDIQPVVNNQTQAVQYFENKKIYFVKKIDGIVKAVY